MSALGNGLFDAGRHEEALSVREAELAMKRRLGDSENNILTVQTNLASTYYALGRHQDDMRMSQNVYSGRLKLLGEEHGETLLAAGNYAASLFSLKRFKEAKALLRRTVPVARRVLGEGHEVTLRMRWIYAKALCNDPGAALDDVREAVATLEDVERIARRVLGGAHPTTSNVENNLRAARAVLAAREAKATEAITPGNA